MVDGLDAPDKQKISDDVEIVQTRQSEKQKAREIFAKRYHKITKYLDTQYHSCYHSKTQTKRFYRGIMPLKDASRIANSKDPDQTASLRAV